MLGSGLTVQLERVVGVPGLAGLDRLLGLMLVTRCLHAMSCIQDRSQSFSISCLRNLTAKLARLDCQLNVRTWMANPTSSTSATFDSLQGSRSPNFRLLFHHLVLYQFLRPARITALKHDKIHFSPLPFYCPPVSSQSEECQDNADTQTQPLPVAECNSSKN